MQMENTEVSLSELLGRSIKDFEKIEDDPKTLTFVARRLGNIVKHMKDLCEDLQPRGGHGGNCRSTHTNERSPQRTESFR
jgi:hypothetical protein